MYFIYIYYLYYLYYSYCSWTVWSPCLLFTKLSHVCPAIKKLGTVIFYLKRFQKVYKSRGLLLPHRLLLLER